MRSPILTTVCESSSLGRSPSPMTARRSLTHTGSVLSTPASLSGSSKCTWGEVRGSERGMRKREWRVRKGAR
eukprot:scaffold7486_cov34-Phaeocystis_antarctica.AAC.1